MNWKARIDKHLEEETQARRALKSMQKVSTPKESVFSKIDKWLDSLNPDSVEYWERHIAEHQNKFKCHICDTPSSGPESVETGSTWVPNPNIEWAGGENVTTYRTDWNSPTGLVRCKNCNRWVCEKSDHIYKGICKTCAERL